MPNMLSTIQPQSVYSGSSTTRSWLFVYPHLQVFGTRDGDGEADTFQQHSGTPDATKADMHAAVHHSTSTPSPMRIMDFVLLAFFALALAVVLTGDMVLR